MAGFDKKVATFKRAGNFLIYADKYKFDKYL
jgi:hypothetical protein